jgi:hypothetical protein
MLLASRRKLTRVDEDMMLGKFRISFSSVFSCTLTNVLPRANNIAVDVREKIIELKEMVDGVTESLSVLADEVTRVTKVGTEGRLGIVFF